MLLTHDDLSQLQIDPNAVRAVPESVARDRLILPVGFRDGDLCLVLPEEAGLLSDDTLDCLRLILERPFTHRLAVTEDLRPFVDLYYSAIYSEVTRCGAQLKLKFRCPKRWADLEPTSDVRVRYCTVCEHSVTFCSTIDELNRLSRQHECVAFYSGADHYEFLGLRSDV